MTSIIISLLPTILASLGIGGSIGSILAILRTPGLSKVLKIGKLLKKGILPSNADIEEALEKDRQDVLGMLASAGANKTSNRS